MNNVIRKCRGKKRLAFDWSRKETFVFRLAGACIAYYVSLLHQSERFAKPTHRSFPAKRGRRVREANSHNDLIPKVILLIYSWINLVFENPEGGGDGHEPYKCIYIHFYLNTPSVKIEIKKKKKLIYMFAQWEYEGDIRRLIICNS